MCTDFLLIAANGAAVAGRTMDLAGDSHPQLVVRRRDTTIISPAPEGMAGLEWTVRHGYVGLNAHGAAFVIDGLNEMGLAAAALWMPDTVHAPPVASRRVLAAELVVDWALGNFCRVADLREALGGVDVFASEVARPRLPPMRFSVHDAQGHSIVIELVDGITRIYDNDLGVVTNAPAFPWHQENVRGHLGLSAFAVGPQLAGDRMVAPFGPGSGMRGLPGDSSSPSRLIRTLFAKDGAYRPGDAFTARNLALHLLNGVDIPMGTSRSAASEARADDHTQWGVVKDLTNRLLAVRTYDHQTLRAVDLTRLDFRTVENAAYAIPLAPEMIDVTAQLS